MFFFRNEKNVNYSAVEVCIGSSEKHLHVCEPNIKKSPENEKNVNHNAGEVWIGISQKHFLAFEPNVGFSSENEKSS